VTSRPGRDFRQHDYRGATAFYDAPALMGNDDPSIPLSAASRASSCVTDAVSNAVEYDRANRPTEPNATCTFRPVGRDRARSRLVCEVDAAPVKREVLRSALMPVINSISVTGVVSLPGIMTRQILGGVPLAEAVKYQILVMFLQKNGTPQALSA
jgi:Uncharacterised protein family (UPF0014)